MRKHFSLFDFEDDSKKSESLFQYVPSKQGDQRLEDWPNTASFLTSVYSWTRAAWQGVICTVMDGPRTADGPLLSCILR